MVSKNKEILSSVTLGLNKQECLKWSQGTRGMAGFLCLGDHEELHFSIFKSVIDFSFLTYSSNQVLPSQ